MEDFLGKSSTFWSGIAALAVCVYTIVFVPSVWFLYRQVRSAAKTFELGAVQRLQELVDDFRDDRRRVFSAFPLDMALTATQFAKRPPGRQKSPRLGANESEQMALTEEQSAALASLDPDQQELARRVIARLNDIGGLIEDGLIDRRMFLGKYHVMVIQCCHMLEAFRRDEELRRGGNYGQRLLRMRRWATIYNDASPKHRAIPITIAKGQVRRLVYQSPPPTLLLRLVRGIRRWLSWYN